MLLKGSFWMDELGIPAKDVPVDQFIPLGRMLYKAPSDGKWWIICYLIIVRDVKLHPNPDEVADVKYVNRDQLKELLRKADTDDEGLKLSPWFRLVVDNFLFKWWDHVERGGRGHKNHSQAINKLDSIEVDFQRSCQYVVAASIFCLIKITRSSMCRCIVKF